MPPPSPFLGAGSGARGASRREPLKIAVTDSREKRARECLEACFPNRPPLSGRGLFCGMQVTTMSRSLLARFDVDDWIAPKTDGTRFLAVVAPRFVALVSRREEIHFARAAVARGFWDSLTDGAPSSEDAFHVVDVEAVRFLGEEGAGGPVRTVFLVLDALCLGGRSVTLLDFEARRRKLRAAFRRGVGELDGEAGTTHARWSRLDGAIGHEFEEATATVKTFHRATRANVARLGALVAEQKPRPDNPFDGLILHARDSIYARGTSDRVLKFKDPADITLDFRLGLDRRDLRYVRVLYRVADELNPVFDSTWVDLSEARRTDRGRRAWERLLSFEGEIVECAWNAGGECWRVARVRRDKKRPNSRVAARDNADTIHSGLTLEEVSETLEANAGSAEATPKE